MKKTTSNYKVLFLAGMTVVSLSGCSIFQASSEHITQSYNKAKKDVVATPPVYKDFVEDNDSWIADGHDWKKIKKVLPPDFYDTITVHFSKPVDIYAIGEEVTNATNIPVAIHVGRNIAVALNTEMTPLSGGIQQGGSSTGTTTTPTTSITGQNGLTGPNNSIGQFNQQNQNNRQNGQLTATTNPTLLKKITITHFSGQLKDFLDLVSSRLGLFWDYSDNRIFFQRYKTKVFQIKAPTAQTSITNDITDIGSTGNMGLMQNMAMSGGMGGTGGIGGIGATGGMGMGGIGMGGMAGGMGGMGGSQGGTPGQNIMVSQASTIWPELQLTLRSILMDQGAFSVSPSTGSVSVTTSPGLMRQVSHYIKKLNKQLTKQIFIRIKVLDIQLTDSEATSVDWAGAARGLAGAVPGLGASATETPTVFNSANNVNPLAATTLTFPNTSMNTLIKNVASQNKISIVTTSRNITLNHQTYPVQAIQTVSYLQSSMVGSMALGGGALSGLVPGSVMVGFTMDITPHLLEDNNILIEMAVDQSQLLAMNTFTSGGQSIQLPNTNSRSFTQRVRIHSGDVLVIAGFQLANTTTEQQGVGTPQDFILGGGMSAQRQHEILAIVMKAVVLE